MARRGPAIVLTLFALASCSRFDRAERPAWRDQAEETCLARHLVEPTQFVQPSLAIEGPSICGLNHPFKVYALSDGTVRLNAASLLDCSMIPALDGWIRDVVQPQALARFGEPVVQINTMGTYACRGINNESGTKLSEHAFANAIDVGGFVLRSGRELNVTRGWSGADEQEAAFLQEAHYNHIHLDLARHGGASRGSHRYCKPEPRNQPGPPRRDDLPQPPPVEEDQDVAGAPLPGSSGGTASLDAAVPPPPDRDPTSTIPDRPRCPAVGPVTRAARGATGPWSSCYGRERRAASLRRRGCRA